MVEDPACRSERWHKAVQLMSWAAGMVRGRGGQQGDRETCRQTQLLRSNKKSTEMKAQIAEGPLCFPTKNLRQLLCIFIRAQITKEIGKPL